MSRLLESVLRRVVVNGGLKVTMASGRTVTIGHPAPDRPPVAVRFTTPAIQRAILLDPELKLGEAYMDGCLVMEEGSIADLLDLLMAQPATSTSTTTVTSKVFFWARMLVRRLAQFNPRARSQRNVAHHYDLDGRLYSLFLDADRQYSCAYFEYPGQSLDDAQLAKKRHIAAKLMLEREDLRVLDIGSGWGGLGLYLAQMARAKVTGVTLSKEQLALARERADEAGLAGRVEFRLQDYRDIPEKFDRIVSVGMFEHVGVAHYGEFFRKVRALLKDDGVMLLHSIGRSDPPGVTNPFIAKYIFPGGYIPALSEVLPHIERAGLVVTDVELLRLHYAETLKAWRERFLARWDEAARLTDERFCRMWEFYLAGSEMGFRHQGLNVFHIQLAARQEAVPLTRGYIEAEEARLRAVETRQRSPLRLAGE
ncbi:MULTISPECIES: cyclopropane-fatty-acyl-phospholipid synthase family protein [unclassified Xanthobacter]|uniref:SAM-dependent methyltransferase n=1 Tax=unclassified Xanthobacter TaxID=2623496 RepID=UPI001F220E1A|nr:MULTISPECIES: cyclopropane-fatty-acyl-phospholipid synthase family protein [unclassified Xanthobacter]